MNKPVARPQTTQMLKQKTPESSGVLSVVAPTGVDPVTFRFSVERSTN